MNTITFDFDDTIVMAHMLIKDNKPVFVFDGYNDKIIELIKSHIKLGDDIHIVTARSKAKEDLFPGFTVPDYLDKLSLSYYFTPDRIHYTEGALKLEKLKELGSTLHYDDSLEEISNNFGQISVKNPFDYLKDSPEVGKAIIYDKNDRILLLRRTDAGKKWDIPGGHLKELENKRPDGHVEGTEREVMEETGLLVPYLDKIGDRIFTWKGKSNNIMFFHTKLQQNMPEVNLEMQSFQENSEYKWVLLDEMPKYADNGTQILNYAMEIAKKQGLISEEEQYQKKMKQKHTKMKKKLIGLGENKEFGGGQGHKRPKMSRSKSAPADFGALEEEYGKKKRKIKVKINKMSTRNQLMREELNKIISESEFDLSKLQLKSSLHPDFWENDNLKEEIVSKLLEIAEEFAKNTEIEGKIEDITLTGSLASYNYHSKSDIDLHLLVDFKKIGKNGDLIKDLMNLMRIKWNESHDIVINGHEVEIYVQDSSEKHYSAGVYSIQDEKWLLKPSPEAKNLDFDAIIDKASSISDEIDEISNEFGLKNYEKSHKMAKKLAEKIKKLRSAGLEDDGIYSVENLAFKLIRNSGKMAILMDLRNKSYDMAMSLGKIPTIKVKIANNIDEKRKKRRKKRRKKAKNKAKYAYYGGYLPHRSDDYGSDGGDGGGGE